MGLGNGALAAIFLLGCICIAAGEPVTARTFEEKNYYPTTPSAPAPSISSPVTPSSPSYSPPYSSPSPVVPSAPAPSTSSPVTPSSPSYSPPYSVPSPVVPSAPTPSSSSSATPSTPPYDPTSPAPSGSSPISLGPALSPLSTPSIPSYSPPSTGSPPCPPLSTWFTPGSSGSPPSWWKDQLAAEDKRRSSLPSTDPAAHTDSVGSSKAVGLPTIPALPPFTQSIPLPPALTPPTTGLPLTPFTPFQWTTAPPNYIPIIISFVTTILNLFGGTSGSIFGSQMTLYQGLTNRRPDAYGALLRQGSAAILNANSNRGYPYSAMQVKASFNAALFSEQTAAVQAVRFENANRGLGVRH